MQNSLSRNLFVVFSSLLLVLSISQPAFAASPSDIIANDILINSSSLRLQGPTSVDTFTISGRTYAIVGSYTENGVQIIDISDPTNISGTDDLSGSSLELTGVEDVDTFTISNGSSYAIVAAYGGNGVQIININNPGIIYGTDSLDDTTDGPLELSGARGVDTFTISNGSSYAIVASNNDNGVQIININNPGIIYGTDSLDNTTDGPLIMLSPRDVDTFTISNGSSYAIVASYGEDGVQLVNISNPGIIYGTATLTDNSSRRLNGAQGVDTFTIGTSVYAIVTAYDDDGVQIINISDPANIIALDAEYDNNNGFARLDQPEGVDTFTIGTSVYAIVTSDGTDDGVQIINISDPANIIALDAETDDTDLIVSEFTSLLGARGVDTFTIGTNVYAIIASYNDDGVQIITLNIPSTDTSSGGGGGDKTPPSITLYFDDTEYPLIINGKQYTADQIKNKINVTSIEIGKPVKIELMLYDDGGPNNVAHVELYVDKIGDMVLNDLNETGIIWDKYKDTQILNPNGIISNGTANRLINNIISIDKSLFTFEISFTKEFGVSDILFVTWDEARNGAKIHVMNALQIQSTNDLVQTVIPTELENTEPNTEIQNPEKQWHSDDYYKKQMEKQAIHAQLEKQLHEAAEKARLESNLLKQKRLEYEKQIIEQALEISSQRLQKAIEDSEKKISQMKVGLDNSIYVDILATIQSKTSEYEQMIIQNTEFHKQNVMLEIKSKNPDAYQRDQIISDYTIPDPNNPKYSQTYAKQYMIQKIAKDLQIADQNIAIKKQKELEEILAKAKNTISYYEDVLEKTSFDEQNHRNTIEEKKKLS